MRFAVVSRASRAQRKPKRVEIIEKTAANVKRQGWHRCCK
jgi:hypothetical protein